MSWCGGRGLRAIVLFSAGCEQSSRAALQLDDEWWYVGTAVPEGGVGGLRRARRGDGSRGGGHGISAALRVLALCCEGDEVTFDAGRWHFG